MDSSTQRWPKSVCSVRATYKGGLVIGEREERERRVRGREGEGEEERGKEVGGEREEL